MESNFYEKSIIGKVWTCLVGFFWLVLITAIIYTYIEDYKSHILGLGITLFGFILLLISKISVFKKGYFFSFGTRLMNQKMTYLYILGYLLIILGLFFIFL